MNIAYLSLGSNLGNRLEYLQKATNLLNEHPAIVVDEISSIYETDAWGMTEQADFYNLVLKIKTTLTPETLLKECQKIELKLKRTRTTRWGPRTIDIDILLYESVEMNEEFLTLPHKHLLERPFVTIPLAEVAPDLLVKGILISDIAKKHKKAGEKCEKLTIQTVSKQNYKSDDQDE